MVDRVPFCDSERINTDPRMIEAYITWKEKLAELEDHWSTCNICPWITLATGIDYEWWKRTGRHGPKPKIKEQCDIGTELKRIEDQARYRHWDVFYEIAREIDKENGVSS